ncbi:hypothetical protein ACKTEK_08980 [Tepidamorphus sp. 3E244]|uniref:hypothetical protein n=1 Tax=Tepidamorphus sp. 3E244 TaxID=3385498 RepID=UPI0038FD3E73
MRKILIFDPAGRQMRGHQYAISKSLTEDLSSHEITVVMHPHADPGAVFAPNVRRIGWPRTRSLREILFGSAKGPGAIAEREKRDRATLARIVADCGLGAGDIIIFHTATGARVRALCSVIADMPEDQRPSAHIRFLTLDQAMDGTGSEEGLRETGRIIKALPQAHAYSENIEMTQHFMAVYGFEDMRPWLIRMTDLQTGDVPEAGDPKAEYVVGFLASQRSEQGPDKLEAIILASADLVRRGEMPPTRFIVRTVPVPPIHRRRKHPVVNLSDDLDERLAGSGVTIERIEGSLSSDAYTTLVQRSHVLAAPYDGKAYWLRSTGLLIDGVNVGRPIVLTPGIAMGDWQDRLSAPRPETIDGFAQALADVANNYPRYAALAKAAREDMNTEMDTVLKDYLGLADHEVAQRNKPGAA